MKTAFAIERFPGCGKAQRRPLHGFDGIARRHAGMKWFGHGAEVADVAAGHGTRHSECVGGVFLRKPQQFRTRRRRSHGADGAGGMPSGDERMQRLGRQAEFRHDLDSDHIAQQHFFA